MGYPLNRYDLFKMISKDENILKINEVFSDIKLYGLLIYDPILNTGIDNLINHSFDKIDISTGTKFLFLSLVTNFDFVDSKIKSKVEQLNKVGCNERKITPDEQRVDAYNLAQLLNVNTEEFPILLLSNSLKFNEFIIIKTDSDNIINQLSKIGQYCESISSKKLNFKNERFKNLIDQLNTVSSIVLNRKNQLNLIDDLIELFIYKLDGYVKDTFYNPSSFNKDQYAKIITKIRIDLFNTKNNEINDHLLLLITRIYGVLPNNENDEFKLDENVEYDSETIIKTFNRLLLMYIDDNGKFINDIDYTPLVICLAKIIEIETNSSIVQWIREGLEIEMPEFFKKYKPDISPDLTSIKPSQEISGFKTRTVNFNSKLNDQWSPPGSGLSNFVTRTLIEVNKYKSPIEMYYDEFVKCWYTIVEIRNPSAHRKILAYDDFEIVFNCFKTLQKNEIFKQLALLRSRPLKSI